MDAPSSPHCTWDPPGKVATFVVNRRRQLGQFHQLFVVGLLGLFLVEWWCLPWLVMLLFTVMLLSGLLGPVYEVSGDFSHKRYPVFPSFLEVLAACSCC